MQACLHVTAHQRNTRNVTSRVFTTEVGEGAIRHFAKGLEYYSHLIPHLEPW